MMQLLVFVIKMLKKMKRSERWLAGKDSCVLFSLTCVQDYITGAMSVVSISVPVLVQAERKRFIPSSFAFVSTKFQCWLYCRILVR